jgi:hypothetical protein
MKAVVADPLANQEGDCVMPGVVDEPSLYRKEALRHHAQAEQLGELLRFPRAGTQVTYWSLVTLGLLAVLCVGRIQFGQYVVVPAIRGATVSDRLACFGRDDVSPHADAILLLPPSAYPGMATGTKFTLRVPGLSAGTPMEVDKVGRHAITAKQAKACLGDLADVGTEADHGPVVLVSGRRSAPSLERALEYREVPATAELRVASKALWHVLLSSMAPTQSDQ